MPPTDTICVLAQTTDKWLNLTASKIGGAHQPVLTSASISDCLTPMTAHKVMHSLRGVAFREALRDEHIAGLRQVALLFRNRVRVRATGCRVGVSLRLGLGLGSDVAHNGRTRAPPPLPPARAHTQIRTNAQAQLLFHLTTIIPALIYFVGRVPDPRPRFPVPSQCVCPSGLRCVVGVVRARTHTPAHQCR